MNNYSQADMAFKKLIDSMKQNGSVFTNTEALLKEINAIIDQNGTDDEDFVCIPLSRYEELLRSESEIDIHGAFELGGTRTAFHRPAGIQQGWHIDTSHRK